MNYEDRRYERVLGYHTDGMPIFKITDRINGRAVTVYSVCYSFSPYRCDLLTEHGTYIRELAEGNSEKEVLRIAKHKLDEEEKQ